MKTLFLFILALGCGVLRAAPAFPPVTSGPAQVVDFLVQDVTSFFADTGMQNGVLRLVRSPAGSFAEVFANERSTPNERERMNPRRVDGRPTVMKFKLGARLARVELDWVAESVYAVRAVDSSDAKLIFQPGATIDFGAFSGGFDLRGPILRVKRTADAKGAREIRLIEMQVPDANVCAAYLSS